MNSPEMQMQLSWDDIVLDVKCAAARMRENGVMLNGVYGIPRGGSCLAVLFSHLLGIEHLTAPRPGCLIVDDISDTGDTLLQYKDYPCTTFTVVAKEASKCIPDYFGIYIPENSPNANAWVVFPWELPKESEG